MWGLADYAVIFGFLFIWFWPEVLACLGYRLDLEELVPPYIQKYGFRGKELKTIHLRKIKKTLPDFLVSLFCLFYPVIGLAGMQVLRDSADHWFLFSTFYFFPVALLVAPFIRRNIMDLITALFRLFDS